MGWWIPGENYLPAVLSLEVLGLAWFTLAKMKTSINASLYQDILDNYASNFGEGPFPFRYNFRAQRKKDKPKSSQLNFVCIAYLEDTKCQTKCWT